MIGKSGGSTVAYGALAKAAADDGFASATADGLTQLVANREVLRRNAFAA